DRVGPAGPAGVARPARAPLHPGQPVHPPRQRRVALAAAITFLAGIVGLSGGALGQRFAEPETAAGRVSLAFFLRKPAKPARANIVVAKAPELVMHLIDQAEREVDRVGRVAHPRLVVVLVLGGTIRSPESRLGSVKPEVVAHRERVGPKIALRRHGEI